ncbi:MAG: DEAD/DEAH box helicase [Promethearchaeota archaeon]
MITLSTKYVSHPLLKENTILRRAYQENIFINCLNKNCLVVIPTGLGKTIVALMLAMHRLSEIPNSKIVFLAPTKPLVEQHFNSFLELTKINSEMLQSITGSTPPDKRKLLWNDIKVAFMTPQVLQNDLISNLYSIRDVALIIFDECHRAVGDYAYCFIAQKYMELSKSPQILGLTASPGSTELKINEIKSNLFIDHIEIRTDSDRDVKPYIHKVDNEWIKIPLPPEYLEIKKLIIEKLKKVYKFLKKSDLLNSSDVNKVTRKDLLKLDKVINKRISSMRDDDAKYEMFMAKKFNANAIRLSHIDELIETQGVNALKDYMDKNIAKIKSRSANKSLIELFSDHDFKRVIELVDIAQEKGLVHPKLKKLKDLLHNQLIENQESRILVFCHYRDSVKNIVRYLKRDPEIRAHKFVGQRSSNTEKGLTQKQQITLLQDFKEGTYNTLIGTSVAEEGLDIAECDVVVFYDVVPSAVRSIQRRGRTGRKKEGKVFILIAEGTRDEGYYWAEKHKEESMKRNLKKLKDSNSLGKEQANLTQYINTPIRSNSIENKIINLKDRFQEIEDKIIIICDNRETKSPVVRKLSLMKVEIILEQLSVADYIISEASGIERKSAKDFTDSIKDGRLFKELFELKKFFKKPILILEGDLFTSPINESALYGAISSIILNLGINVYRTADTNETTLIIYHLAKKAQSTSKGDFKIRFEKKPFEDSELLEYIIAGIPGINASRAKNLLMEFKSLQEIFNAEIDELLKTEKIGRKIADEIYRISRYEYDKEL